MLKRLLMVLVAVLLVAVPATAAQGAPGGGPGKPPDAGQGGGGNGGGGQGNQGNKLGDLYADLMVIARYADGTPITVQYDTHTCVQPITPTDVGAPVEGAGVYPYVPDMYYIPLVGEQMTDEAEQLAIAGDVAAEDEDELEPCDVQAGYLEYVEEVDLGRLNLGRAPERVLRKQLSDVELFLTSGDIALDASGRFTRSVDEVVVQTLDSPLANLAAYQAILKSLPAMIGEVSVADLGVDLNDWGLTAAQFAAAAPKEDFVITVDTAQYLNRILGIPEATPRATLDNADLGEKFLDYAGFSYTRGSMFRGSVCHYPVASPDAEEIEFLAYLGGPMETKTGIDGYVRFAEDAHQVLVLLHAMGDNVIDVDPITENTVVCPPETTP